ncbi:hypothetical protein ACSW87_04910 [Clostridium perfringens]
MKNTILKFDQRIILKDEMLEHIKFYSKKANEGMELFEKGNKKEAMSILREIRSCLKEEYSYYDKVKVQKIISENKLYSTYCWGVFQAYVKQMKPNSYETLYSNLYDVEDYITNYEMYIFNQ